MTNKPSKPTGRSASIRFTKGVDKSISMAEEQLLFPNQKDEIELFIANLFVETANELKEFSSPISDLKQNPERDLDFTIYFGYKKTLLELAEFAPLSHFGGTYKNAPTEYNVGTFTDYYIELVQKKSTHQGGSGRILLSYATHASFSLGQFEKELAKRKFRATSPKFDAVYFLTPHQPMGASIEKLYPSELNPRLANFSDEKLRGAKSLKLGINSVFIGNYFQFYRQ